MDIYLLKIYFLFNILFLKAICITLKVNYFNDNKNLYFINPINNPNGDLYFEFYGNSNKIRYINKLNITSGKEIYFNNDKVKQINTEYSTTNHESIIVNINNDGNDYIFTISYNKIELINIKEGSVTYKSTDKVVYKNSGSSSYRNYLYKLNDNNYLLSLQIEGTLSHYAYVHKFNFESNEISEYNKLESEYITTNYVNSTCCFQTIKYIQCIYCRKLEPNTLTLVYYDFELDEKNTENLDDAKGNTFVKIISIRGDIGAYVYFNYYTNKPILQINKLIEPDPEVEPIYNFEFLEINGDGKYTLNNDIFLSDLIKINDTRISVILTTEDLKGLLIYIVDAYDDNYKLNYYYIDLNPNNIQISNTLRSFIFRENLGISFYNSKNSYSGYLIFNYPNITENSPKEIILLAYKNPTYTFSLKKNIEISNNIFNYNLNGIKIIDFWEEDLSSVELFSYILNSKLVKNQELSINDKIIFKIKNSPILGKYMLRILPIIKENTLLTKNIIEITYVVDCGGYWLIEGDSKTCVENCKDYNLTNYIEPNGTKICTSDSCHYDNITIFFDSETNTCFYECYYYQNKCVPECPQNYSFDSEKICYLIEDNESDTTLDSEGIIDINTDHSTDISSIGDEITSDTILDSSSLVELDENNDIITNEINNEHSSLVELNDNNDILTNNGNNDNYKKKIININNECEKLFYIDSSDKINCLSINECPKEYPYLYNNNQCNNCPYYYQNKCYQSCPENTCVDSNEASLLNCKSNNNKKVSIYNNICIDNFDSLINEVINKNNNTNLNIINKTNDITVYSYSSKLDFNILINNNNNLVYINNINEYLSKLMNENIEEREYQIVCIQSPSKLSNSIIDNFSFEIYTKEGKKVLELPNLSLNELNVNISFPINDLDLIKYEQALMLHKQGYDIYNKSSDFYYDFCSAAYINNSDIVIEDRQQDIFPNNISLCPVDCQYDSFDYDNKRVNCICVSNSYLGENNNKEEDTSEFFPEEVESNFFIYFIDMINYKIVICYEHLFKFENYYYNYGFYVCFFVIMLFFTLFFVFFIIGNKKIRMEYFKNEIKSEYRNLDIETKQNNKTKIINKNENLKKADNLENVLIISSNSNPPKKRKNKKLIVKSCLSKDNKNQNKKIKTISFKNEKKDENFLNSNIKSLLNGKSNSKKRKKRKKRLKKNKFINNSNKSSLNRNITQTNSCSSMNK